VLHIASQYGHVEVVQILQEYGAKLCEVNRHLTTGRATSGEKKSTMFSQAFVSMAITKKEGRR